MNIAGVGYPTPYLRPFIENSERVVALMPAQQRALRWPAEEGNIVSLALEEGLPLPDESIDRVLMIHVLEYSDQIRKLLREVWRVMTEGGRVLIVVPNRRGKWARVDHTPFGHGQPFTAAQMSRLLRNNLFQPECWLAGLFCASHTIPYDPRLCEPNRTTGLSLVSDSPRIVICGGTETDLCGHWKGARDSAGAALCSRR